MNAFSYMARAVTLDALRDATPATADRALRQAALYAPDALPQPRRKVTVHIVAPAAAVTLRGRRRAYNNALPVHALLMQLRGVRREIATARYRPPAYELHRLLARLARLALEAARTRGALLAHGRADLAAAPVCGEVGS